MNKRYKCTEVKGRYCLEMLFPTIFDLKNNHEAQIQIQFKQNTFVTLTSHVRMASKDKPLSFFSLFAVETKIHLSSKHIVAIWPHNVRVNRPRQRGPTLYRARVLIIRDFYSSLRLVVSESLHSVPLTCRRPCG